MNESDGCVVPRRAFCARSSAAESGAQFRTSRRSAGGSLSRLSHGEEAFTTSQVDVAQFASIEDALARIAADDDPCD